MKKPMRKSNETKKAPPQLETAPGARVKIDGREYDYYCGTGYLALQGHPRLAQAVCDSVQRYGIGPATSRLGYGLTPAIAALEQQAAAFFATDRALYFASGYFGPAILLQGLQARYDHIFVDEQSHYAIRDGIALSQKPSSRFAHCDPENLAQTLQQKLKPGQRPLVISDGVFPASGALAPLPAYHRLLQNYRGLLCIDDAHGFGVLGANGRGSLEYWGIEGEGRHACGTLSKAFGGHGGLIAGSQPIAETSLTRSH